MKFVEFILVLFAVLLTTSAGFLYVSDISLRKYLLGIQEFQNEQRVGYLVEQTGKTRRKQLVSAEFEKLVASTTLYNYDTIVTESNGGALIRLDDGGKIELGENTMVRLEFESRLAIGGIAHQTTVNIVSGEVAGEVSPSSQKSTQIILRSKNKQVSLNKEAKQKDKIAVKKPKPIAPTKTYRPPTKGKDLDALLVGLNPKGNSVDWQANSEQSAPTGTTGSTGDKESGEAEKENTPPPEQTPKKQIRAPAKIIYPTAQTKLEVKSGSTNPAIPLSVKFSLGNKTSKGTLTITRFGETKRKVFEKQVTGDLSQVQTVLLFPGEYEVEIQSTPDSPTRFDVKTRFKANAQFRGIELKDELIAGAKGADLTEKILKDFSITLRWKEYPQATTYLVELFKRPGAKPISSKRLSQTSWTMNKGKVFTGSIWYQVSSKLPNGFKPISRIEQFSFDLMAPVPALPNNQTQFSQRKLQSEGGNVVFTWQTTNFTDQYLFELAMDSDFKKIVKSEKTQNNFLMVDVPKKTGRFYWRVKGYAKGKASKFSQSFSFMMGK